MGMEEVTLADDTTLDVESPVSARINSWARQHCTTSTQKSIVFFYISNEHSEIEMKTTIYTNIKKYEILKNNVQDPYTENYKTLLREIKENLS